MMVTAYVSVKKLVIEDELKYRGITLLTYRIEYPQFRSAYYTACLSRINQYYAEKAREYQHYCETDLFQSAIEQYRYDIENHNPVRVFEALQVYHVTYLYGPIISLYFDRYEYTGGAHGNTVRSSQTWQLQCCGLIPLEQLVRCPPNTKAYVLARVEQQIRRDPKNYFENSRELIFQYYNDEHFYCTRQGIVFYYQQYEIAPYASGIPEFFIKYSRCVINPGGLYC